MTSNIHAKNAKNLTGKLPCLPERKLMGKQTSLPSFIPGSMGTSDKICRDKYIRNGYSRR